jgi:hypothetical protein
MRLSYEAIKPLIYLKNKKLGLTDIFENDLIAFSCIKNQAAESFRKNVGNFSSSINIISNPFYEAFGKSKVKLSELLIDILKNDLSDYCVEGTYIFGDYVHMINFDSKKGSDDMKLSYFLFSKDGTILCFVEEKESFNAWISEYFHTYGDTQIRLKTSQFISEVSLLSMFKKYADVETKQLQPKQRIKDFGCKYTNDTDFTAMFLDCKWFTNLIKSDSFNVRGHFRLQPKKKDEQWIKELIWINEFKKHGYNSRAKILMQ